MKKLIFGAVIFMLSALSVCAVAYGATAGYTMKYLPGTSDSVANMPTDDRGVGGSAFSVSSEVPQRDGYEFIDWTLDYGLADTYKVTYEVYGDSKQGKPIDVADPDAIVGIHSGDNVNLETMPAAADVSLPNAPKGTYKVNYLEVGTDKVLAPQKVVENVAAGKVITENAIDIDGYIIEGAESQNITIKQENWVGKWRFDGWSLDSDIINKDYFPIVNELLGVDSDMTVYGKWVYWTEDLTKNEITFYYSSKPAPKLGVYTVEYIDAETGEKIIPDKEVSDVEIGILKTEYPVSVDGYEALFPSITFTTTGNDVLVFLYFFGYGPVD